MIGATGLEKFQTEDAQCRFEHVTTTNPLNTLNEKHVTDWTLALL